MPGSRKGERRGAAGRGKVGGPRGPRINLKPKEPLTVGKRGRNRMTEERERMIYDLITGRPDLMPREGMLEAMRYFFDVAREYLVILKSNLQLRPESAEDTGAVNRAITHAESQVERYYVMASDIAYKVAPYVHARLSAMAVVGNTAGAMDIMQHLLEDIEKDERERSMLTIEHRQSENNVN